MPLVTRNALLAYVRHGPLNDAKARETDRACHQRQRFPVVLNRSVTMDDQHEDRLRLSGVQRALAPPVRRSGGRRVGDGVLPGLAAEDRHVEELRIEPRHHRLGVHAWRRGRPEPLRAVRRRELLHVAHDDRDSASRLHGGDQGHQPRRLLHVPAGDGGARCRRIQATDLLVVHADGPAQQLALALRRAAIHGSRQAGRPLAGDGMAGPSPREHSAAQSRRRRCARSASRTDFRKRSLARRRRCPSPIRRTTPIGGVVGDAGAAARVHARPTTPSPTNRCIRRRSTPRTPSTCSRR